jgi:hypothetical protein
VRRTELLTAAVLVVLGLATILVVIPQAVDEAPVSGGLSPAFMPYVAAALGTAAALGWLVQLLRHADPEPAAAERGDWRFIGLAVLVLGGAYWLMGVLGFVAGGAALVAGALALARARLATIAGVALVAPAALWWLFAHVLATPLP